MLPDFFANQRFQVCRGEHHDNRQHCSQHDDDEFQNLRKQSVDHNPSASSKIIFDATCAASRQLSSVPTADLRRESQAIFPGPMRR